MLINPVEFLLQDDSSIKLLYSNGAAKRVMERTGVSLLTDPLKFIKSVDEKHLSGIIWDMAVRFDEKKNRWVHDTKGPTIEDLDELITSQRDAMEAFFEAFSRANPRRPEDAPVTTPPAEAKQIDQALTNGSGGLTSGNPAVVSESPVTSSGT